MHFKIWERLQNRTRHVGEALSLPPFPGAKHPCLPWKGRWLSVSETGGVCPSVRHLPFQGRLGVTCIRRHMLMHMMADASTPHVRGGSVSRRGLNQAYQRPPPSQAEPPPKKQPTQTPAALRERGSGGEALLSEKRSLPQSLPPKPQRSRRLCQPP